MVAMIRTTPPNSLLLVTDPLGGEMPTTMNNSLIAATDSCIAVGCSAEDDGETEIRLGMSSSVDPGSTAAFQGRLRTPSRKIVVRTVLGAVLLEIDVPTIETTVRIWANDLKEPDKVIVGIG